MSLAKRPSVEAVHPQTGTRMPLAAGYFAYFGVVGIYTPFLSVWLAHRGYSALVIGSLAALASGLRIIGPFAVAWWFDHVRSRRPWFVAAAVIVCAAWGSVQWRATGSPVDSLAVPVAMLAMVYAAYSLAFNSLLSAYDAFVLDCLGPAQREYGRLRWWGSAGFIVTSTLVGQWVSRSGAEVVMPALIAAAMVTVGVYCLLPADPPRPARAAPARAVFAALKQQPVLVLGAVNVLHLAGFSAYYTYFSLYLQQHGYAATHIGLLWAWGVVAEIAVFLAGPWLVARFRLRTLLQWAILGTALRWCLLATTVDHVALTWLGQTLHLAGFGLFHTVGVLLLPRLLPAGASSRAQAISGSLGWGLGGMLGALGAAWAWQALGPASAFGLSAVLTLAASLVAALGLRGPGLDRIDPTP